MLQRLDARAWLPSKDVRPLKAMSQRAHELDMLTFLNINTDVCKLPVTFIYQSPTLGKLATVIGNPCEASRCLIPGPPQSVC